MLFGLLKYDFGHHLLSWLFFKGEIYDLSFLIED